MRDAGTLGMPQLKISKAAVPPEALQTMVAKLRISGDTILDGWMSKSAVHKRTRAARRCHKKACVVPCLKGFAEWGGGRG